MAGLLDAFNDPGFQRGLLMMAASRPMSEQQRAGLLSYIDNQEQHKQQRELMGLKMEGERTSLAAKNMEIEAAKRAQDQRERAMSMLGGWMGGTPNAPAGDVARLGMESAPGFAGPVSPQAQATAQAPARTLADMPYETALQIEMLGGPKLRDYVKDAKQGTKFDPGAMYRMADGSTFMAPKLGEGQMFDGQRVMPVPGAAQANADYIGAQTAAQEWAKVNPQSALKMREAGIAAQHDLTPVPMGDGSTRLMPRSAALAGAGAPAASAGFGVQQSPANAAYDTDAAKSAQAQYQAWQSAGMKAPGMISKLDQLGQLLAEHDGGKLSPTGLQMAQVANSFGFKIDKNLGNKEAAAALANEMALSLRNTAEGGGMPGAMSDKDREFLVSMVPGLTQSADGRKKLIEATKASYQRQMDVSKMARAWQQRYGRIDAPNPTTGKTFYDNLQEWSERNRLFSE